MASGHGGARKGAGRKRKAEEMRTQELALKAIRDKYGSEDAGFQSLLESKDPTLQKWVFEHAYGKPKERIDIDMTVDDVRTVDIDDDGKELDDQGNEIIDDENDDDE